MANADVVWASDVVAQASPDASWNPTTKQLVFATAGLYEISITHRHYPDDDAFFENDCLLGVRSDAATPATNLNNGSHHYVAAITSDIMRGYDLWFGDLFYYEATAGESIDLTVAGITSNGAGLTVQIGMDLLVRKIS